MDVVSHLPVLCEDAAVPYVFVASKVEFSSFHFSWKMLCKYQSFFFSRSLVWLLEYIMLLGVVLVSTHIGSKDVIAFDGGKRLQHVLASLAATSSVMAADEPLFMARRLVVCSADVKSTVDDITHSRINTGTILTSKFPVDLMADGVSGLHTFALDSTPFRTLRLRGDAFVDKTGAIADLLMSDEGMFSRTRAFFARMRKFGKSLTLDIAAEMLAAGELPEGILPWTGYVPVDITALFGGLAVHNRLLSKDLSLRGLLQRAHFVVKLGLGLMQTGNELKSGLIAALAGIAGDAFGAEIEGKVASMPSVGASLVALIRAVPIGVPIAVLVDEYDAPIIRDVTKRNWGAADKGIDSLRSLLMTSKDPAVGGR
jgi:hypothetical protein